MTPTLRAAVTAGLATGAAVFLIGWFLGIDWPLALLSGLVMGIVGGLLIAAAARRAGAVETRVQPRFPGPPDPAPEGSEPPPAERTAGDSRDVETTVEPQPGEPAPPPADDDTPER